MIEVVNRQRRRKIETQWWASLAEKMLREIEGHAGTVTIAFVSDSRITELNRKFRNVNKATDVLSFPAEDNSQEQIHDRNLGDIAISVDRAEAQAKENGLEFDEEVSQLILHGLLHLCGYDHETDNGEMNRIELRLRRKLGV